MRDCRVAVSVAERRLLPLGVIANIQLQFTLHPGVDRKRPQTDVGVITSVAFYASSYCNS